MSVFYKEKSKYYSPVIGLIYVEIEECVASGSNNEITIGGPNGASAPEIEDAAVENNSFDITF